MARLSAQLKYLIAKKVAEDADWRGVEIVLSGHEVRLSYHLSTLADSIRNRCQEKESTKLWNTFDFPRLNRVTIQTFDIVFMGLMRILSCSVY